MAVEKCEEFLGFVLACDIVTVVLIVIRIFLILVLVVLLILIFLLLFSLVLLLPLQILLLILIKLSGRILQFLLLHLTRPEHPTSVPSPFDLLMHNYLPVFDLHMMRTPSPDIHEVSKQYKFGMQKFRKHLNMIINITINTARHSDIIFDEAYLI